MDELGEEFSAEPSVEDFLRQLEFNVHRLKQHKPGARVIYERCPIDFLAYIECLSQTHDDLTTRVSEAIENLDLIVYLPIDNTIYVPQDEFPKLRKAVDRRLSEIYRDDELGIFNTNNPAIIEATGPTEKRVRTLEAATQKRHSSRSPCE